MNTSHASNAPKTFLADLGLVYASAIWGSTFFIVKNTLANIHPVTLVAYRFLLAAGLMAIYLLIERKPLFKNFGPSVVAGVTLILIYLPQTIGLGYTSAANSAFITGLFVAFVPIFSFLFPKVQPRPAQWAAVGISLVGLWLLTGGLSNANFGDLITLITSAAYSMHIMLSDRYIRRKIEPLAFTFQQFLVVGFVSLAAAWLLDIPLGISSTGAKFSVIFLALFPTLSAFLVQFKAQEITSPVKVALVFALEPVFAAIFAWTLGGESVTTPQIFGGLVIFLAILVSTVQPRKQKIRAA